MARAYRELETAGLIRTRRGAGSRVATPPAGPTRPYASELATPARDFTASARAVGADTEAVMAAVRDALGPDRP
ncbi:hypothetical protein [Streptomyces sp. NPDC001621]|uniref:hypothetical protein n=1 Tax=Streptomyces sp. NPDC001621 TaxID=3364594 RepID=UPI00369B5906